jgi:trehalose 6-phosphate phosphatase
MKPILTPLYRPVLQPFFGAGAVLAFDYDGTLAPIVAQPSEAHMRPETRALLDRVARRYPVAVITGRARLDVLRFLQGIPLLDVIGNHGYEVFGASPPPALQCIPDWHRKLSALLRDLPGVVIEDKRYSLSVHYRACADTTAAAVQVRAAAELLVGARLVGGKAVLNIVVEGAPNKGIALMRLRAKLGNPAAVFVGDDDTDEDAFALTRDTDTIGIRVGANPESAAEYCVADQHQIDDLLRAFEDGARLRANSTPPTIVDR